MCPNFGYSITGLDPDKTAIASGRDALEELAARRRGLAIALALIALLLVGLRTKIRRLAS